MNSYIIMLNIIFLWGLHNKFVTICKHTTTTENVIATAYGVMASRPNFYETEKSNSVYGFLWTCRQRTNYFVESYERPPDKSSLIPPSSDVEWNPKESWQMYDFIQYSMLVIDGFSNTKHISVHYILTTPSHAQNTRWVWWVIHRRFKKSTDVWFVFLCILIILFPLERIIIL